MIMIVFDKSLCAAKLWSLLIAGVVTYVVTTIVVKLFDVVTEFFVDKETEKKDWTKYHGKCVNHMSS